MSIKGFLPLALAAVLLFLAGWHLADSLRSFNPRAVSANDAATSWDDQMRLVAAALPRNVAIVGYLQSSDFDPSIPRRDSAELYLTRYGLAPTVVQLGANYEWVIGNFGKDLAPWQVRRALGERLGPYSVQVFGSRIYLIHRLAK